MEEDLREVLGSEFGEGKNRIQVNRQLWRRRLSPYMDCDDEDDVKRRMDTIEVKNQEKWTLVQRNMKKRMEGRKRIMNDN